MKYYWFITSLAYWSLIYLVIPHKYIKRILLFGFLGGFVYTWIVQYIGVHILNLWSYKYNLFSVYDIPFFFIISWLGVTLLYSYLLLIYPRYQLNIIAGFVGWTSLASYFSVEANVLVFDSWSHFLTLLFAITSHILLLYLLKWVNNVEKLGPNEDILNLKSENN